VGDPQRVHRVLRVVAVLAAQLAGAAAAHAADEAAALRVHVAQERAAGAPADEGRGQLAQPVAERRAHHQLVLGHEQQQQRRRAPLEDQPHVLAQAVDRQVEVARAARLALGAGAVDEVVEATQPDHVLARLHGDAHLVAVVGAGVREPVHHRAHQTAQDAAALGDLTCALGVGLLAVSTGHDVQFTR
jgi:hypothetical protein